VTRRTAIAVLATVALCAPLAFVVGAGAAVAPRTAPKPAVSTLTMALPAGSVPTSVFPFYSAAQCTTTNIDYWNLTTRPGYWFGLGRSVSLIPALSTLNPASITTMGLNTTVTFTVKGWEWSNGAGGTESMTAADVAFFLNMDRAQVHQGANAFCGYVPGYGLPDQVLSVAYPSGLSGSTVRIVFSGHPDHQWLLYQELSQIVPLAKAWDTIGSGFAGCSTEPFFSVKQDGSDTCTAVFNYLSALRINDPLWDWADGPYRQQSAPYVAGSPDGHDVQVANADYSGPVAARAVQTIAYAPYADTPAEIADLRANKLDLGYVNPSNVSRSPGPGLSGRNLDPHLGAYNPVERTSFGVFYWMFNLDNADSSYRTAGPMPTWAKLNNLSYFRAAMQASVNQAAVIDHAYNGYAIPTYSAIPAYPQTAYGTGVANPYRYSASKSRALMRAHGWNTAVFPDVCAASNCGTAQFPIPRGARAALKVSVPAGAPAVSLQVREEAASLRRGAGIRLTPVFPGGLQLDCAHAAWELCGYGGWIDVPEYYPSGEVLFAPGSTTNLGGYDSAEMSALVQATTASGDLALNQRDPSYRTSFAQFSATDVPFLWQPTPASIVEQIRSLRGEQPQNPLGDFNPEYVTQI
jgi:peptide/nickel transport system substrate-binding protein